MFYRIGNILLGMAEESNTNVVGVFRTSSVWGKMDSHADRVANTVIPSSLNGSWDDGILPFGFFINHVLANVSATNLFLSFRV